MHKLKNGVVVYMAPSHTFPLVDISFHFKGGSYLDPADKVAIIVTTVWILLCFLFVTVVGLGEGETLGPLRFLIVLLAIFLPIALIWIAVIAQKSARIVREESERLQASMNAMRQIYVSQAQMSATTKGPSFRALL